MDDDLSAKLDSLISREQDPFTAQEDLLSVVNNIRCGDFAVALRDHFDAVDELVRDNQRCWCGCCVMCICVLVWVCV